MKRILIVLFIVACFGGISSFTKNERKTAVDKIEWLTLDQAFVKNQQSPRKILVDVYTDWCGWCKVMDKKTFTDPAVVSYVNEHFYAVKLDAESKTPLNIGGVEYGYDPENRSHKAAVALLQGKMSFPTIVYLDETFNMIQPIPGYMDAEQFHKIITFIGGDYHKKEQFDKYVAGTYKEVFKRGK